MHCFRINSWLSTYKTLALWIFLHLSFFAALHAQQNPIKFEHISIQQGLSQSTVSCILQDKKGFMWFGTEDGLNRFDGYNFVIYKNDGLEKASLSDSYILSLYEDKSGVLWIGTYSGGLNKFDRDKEQFIHYKHAPDSIDTLSDNMVQSIYEDGTGTLWIGTYDGLNKFNRENERFTQYKYDPDNPTSLSHNRVNVIFEDKNGMLWIGTEGGGLNRYDPEKREFTHWTHQKGDPDSLSNDVVHSIFEDKSGLFWIGTDKGLNRFDRKKEKFTSYIHESNNPQSLSHDRIGSIFEGKTGELWVGTFGGGLNRFDRENERFAHWRDEPGSSMSLNNNHILSIYEDGIGIIWIGTFGGGINRFYPEKSQFAYWTNEPGNSNSLSHNFALSIFEDKDGMLWIGTDGGGVNRFDRAKMTFEHWVNEPGNPHSLSNNRVRAIHEDRFGILWIGTYDGLNRFDKKNGQFTRFRHDPSSPDSISHDYVRVIYEDRSGMLWIGTFGGLNKFDREEEKFTSYIHDPGNPHSLSNDRIVSICEDREGLLWLGTGNGLNRFDREKQQFTHWVNEPGNPDSLSNNRVLSIYEDKKGVLWIGTYGGGLNRFDRKEERFIHYNEKDGLPNDVIYGILEDNEGNLWLSTNKGLSRFNPQSETFKNYDVSDGLQSDEFNSGAYHKNRNGEMFFGGINGFNAFFPGNVKDNPHIPSLVITDFQIFNKSVPIGKREDGRTILRKFITETEEISLSHKDRVFSFEFAALHFISPEKNEYAYVLEGFEKQWNYVGNRRFATYTNLPSGKYTFRVKGTNNDGIWNEEGTSLKITVIPPFWQTWWFRALVILFIIFFVVSVYQTKTKAIRDRAHQLEARVQDRTAELKESKIFLQGVFDGIQDGISVLDRDLNIIQVNQWIENKYASEMPLVGKKCYTAYQKKKSPCPWCPSIPSIKTKKIHTATVPYPSFEKPTGWIELTSFPRIDADGHLAGIIEHVKDITKRKHAEDDLKTSLREKEVLLKEIHHRVKNNMQIISSLLNLQSSSIKNEKSRAIFKKSRDRIRSMALIHEKLYKSEDMARIDFAQYIQDLILHLMHSYRADLKTIKIKTDLEDVYLDINTAIPCGLIVNELVSNSLKHAFPEDKHSRENSDSKNEININLYTNENKQYILKVTDNGLGLPADFDFRNTKSLGLQLVYDLVQQLGGSIDLQKIPGATFKITFSAQQ